MLVNKKLDLQAQICYNPASMYSDYLKERENAEILQLEHGFAVVRQLPDCLYLQDIYVVPEKRKSGYGKHILEIVQQTAKDMGYSKILGSCSPSANGSTVSLKAILACGFMLQSSEKDIIYLVKEI